MKKLLTLIVLLCVVALQTYAQTDSVAGAQKQAEQFAKQADENPNDGKLQYNAGMAFVNEELKDKKDYALAQQYLERALKIAEEQTVMKDTLMGLTCQGLAIVYMGKNDPEKFATYLGKSVDAFEKELGKYDPLTIGNKLIGSWLMMRSNAFISYSNILEAFVNNDNAPEKMRIENMKEANIILELSTEMFIAYITEMFRYALPMVYYKGKGCLVVQSADWNIERPLVGWMVPDMLRTDEERSTHKRDQALLYDGEKIIALSEEERNQNMLQVSFNHFVKNPRKLVGKEGDSRIYFLSPEEYGKILYAYRVYKAGTK